MAALRRPAGAFVAADVARQLDQLMRGDFHDVEIVISAGPTPTECQQLAVRRPCRVNDISLIGKVNFCLARTIGVHNVELRNSSAVADESHLLAGLWIPRRRSARAGGKGDAFG